jgi:hypothetical protein
VNGIDAVGEPVNISEKMPPRAVTPFGNSPVYFMF